MDATQIPAQATPAPAPTAPVGDLPEITDEQAIAIQKQLAEEMGISDLSDDQQKELMAKMTEVVLKRIMLETLEKLSEADKGAYLKMVEEGADTNAIQKFLEEKIPTYNTMVEKIVAEFKEEMKKEV